MKDQVYQIITLLAIVAYYVPFLLVILKKMWKDTYFLYLGIYWLAGALVNTITSIPGIDTPSLEIIIVVYNMIDIPLILWILWYTSFSSTLAKILKVLIIVYIVTELILVLRIGVNYDAIKYIMGAGVLVVLGTLVWEITLYLQRIEHSNRERAMLVIYAALLFEYGSYMIVYIFEYLIFKPENKPDVLLIYYISTLITVSIACFGFLLKENKKSLAFK